MQSICVFSGSSMGADPGFAELAAGLARCAAGRGLRVVYGGARVGIMGVLADAALAAGGEVVGVIPRHMAAREIAHDGLTELHVVGSMHERKALMADLADAFVTLPGGLGTLDELSEVLTWAQLGLHAKPVGLLDDRDFFDGLLAWIDRAVDDGFVAPRHRALLVRASTPDDALDALGAWTPPPPGPERA